MKKIGIVQYFLIVSLIILSVSLSTIAFFILNKSGLVTNEPAKISDWLSALISTLAFVSGVVVVILSYQSLKSTRNAEEGQLYLKMMERYSSEKMVAALRLLGKFKAENKDNLKLAVTKWKIAHNKKEEDANEIENARHTIKYFYRDLMQMNQARYLSDSLTKRILNTGGRHLFKDMVLEMEPHANPFQFEAEFGNFNKFHDELNMELKSSYPDTKPTSICLIPARYDASRFDGKLLKVLVDKKNNKEKTVIRETYERMVSYNLFDEVYVVTNSLEIKNEIEKHGGKVHYSNVEHHSGTDRIAEAIQYIDGDIIFNVQGDEPFIAKKPLEDLLVLMKNEIGNVTVASLMKELINPDFIKSSDYVKVTFSKLKRAISFSRSVIPFAKKEVQSANYFEHVGVYVFTKSALKKFANMEPTVLEKVESIECLRFLENDIPILMVETDTFLLEIDTEADLVNVNNLLAEETISLV